MTAMTPGLDVRHVTDVDRRTARRLGMDADKVNLVINTWASEYLNYEMEQGKLRAAANPGEAKAAKPARKRTPAKATSAPRKTAKAAADTPTPPVETQSPTEADVAATAEGSPS